MRISMKITFSFISAFIIVFGVYEFHKLEVSVDNY